MQKRNYNEIFVHVSVCTHKEPKEILIISDNPQGLLDEIQKYKNINTTTIATDMENIRNLQDNSYDIVLCEAEVNDVTVAHVNRALKEDALASFNGFNLLEVEASKAKLQAVTKYFKIAMPFSLLSHQKALLASKEYHPTADINLQRADLTDGYEVYNSDLHVALFAMPTYIKKTYLGYIRN